jgi:hypothetical protein
MILAPRERQSIRGFGSPGHHRDAEQPAEDGKTFDAVGMRPSQPLHERREVGVVRPKPVGGHAAPYDEPGLDASIPISKPSVTR